MKGRVSTPATWGAHYLCARFPPRKCLDHIQNRTRCGRKHIIISYFCVSRIEDFSFGSDCLQTHSKEFLMFPRDALSFETVPLDKFTISNELFRAISICSVCRLDYIRHSINDNYRSQCFETAVTKDRDGSTCTWTVVVVYS